jgi:1-acyl-sn-glycerol-3-phosphate acyltransferase
MLPSRTVPGTQPSDPLYAAVGSGMWAYTRAAFRCRTLFPPGFAVRRGRLLVATHRAESDVPLIGAAVFYDTAMWRGKTAKLHFAARDDLFERGFFAGFPPALPGWARRLLWRIEAGPYLPLVRVNPLPYPGTNVLRLGTALAAVDPATPLDGLLPPAVAAALAERAAASRLPRPASAADALRGEYADLLWEVYDRTVLAAEPLAPVWRRRAEVGAEQVRRIVEVVGSGEPLLLFPEGKPSPDGSVGPFRPGLRLLVRRGRPEAVQPLAIAYDPLTCGRPFAYLAAGEELAPPAGDVDEAVLAALRRTLPLTCGQIVAAALRGRETISARELDETLADAVAAAQAGGRPVAPELAGTTARRARLTDALRRLLRDGILHRLGAGELTVDAARAAADGRLARLATERDGAGG